MGIRKGDRVYVLTSDDLWESMIKSQDIDNLLRSDRLMRQRLLSVSKDRRVGLEELEIEEVDEVISRARVKTGDFLNRINVNQNVIRRPGN